MKIDNDHMYHGAALIQIAEHPKFTSINSLKVKTVVVENGYEVNDGIGVLLKYARKPVGRFGEYLFGFTQENLGDIVRIDSATNSLFLALVCVKAREICSLSYQEFCALIQRRKTAKGADEDQYQILVTTPRGKGFRVYVNAPGVKKRILGSAMIVSRSNFPEKIFG